MGFLGGSGLEFSAFLPCQSQSSCAISLATFPLNVGTRSPKNGNTLPISLKNANALPISPKHRNTLPVSPKNGNVSANLTQKELVFSRGKAGFVQNAWLRWIFVILKVQGCLGLLVFVGRLFWNCRCFCRFKGEMLGAMSDDAVTEPKPKRIKVKYGDVEQGIQISHDVSVEDSLKLVAGKFGFSSPDSITLSDADGYAVVPSYGNVANDQIYTVHANPAPSDAPHLHLRTPLPLLSL